MNSYLIRTNHFGIALTKFHFLRSGYSYRNVDHEMINQIEIKQAVPIKHPIRTFIFGLLLTIMSLYYIPTVSTIFDKSVLEKGLNYDIQSSRFTGFLIVMVGFTLILGIYSIVLSLKKEIILKIKLTNGKKYVFTLKELPIPNGIFDLMTICKTQFGSRFQNKSEYGLRN